MRGSGLGALPVGFGAPEEGVQVGRLKKQLGSMAPTGRLERRCHGHAGGHARGETGRARHLRLGWGRERGVGGLGGVVGGV